MAAGPCLTATKVSVQRHKPLHPLLTSLWMQRTTSSATSATTWARIILRLPKLCVSMNCIYYSSCVMFHTDCTLPCSNSGLGFHTVYSLKLKVLLCVFMRLITLTWWAMCFISCHICEYVVMKIPSGFLWKKDRRKKQRGVYITRLEPFPPGTEVKRFCGFTKCMII